MLEKIKSALKYVALPLTLVLGFIFYLFRQVDALKGQVAQAKSEKDLAVTLNKLEEAGKDADAKETEFNSDYSDFKRAEQSGKSGLPGDAK